MGRRWQPAKQWDTKRSTAALTATQNPCPRTPRTPTPTCEHAVAGRAVRAPHPRHAVGAAAGEVMPLGVGCHHPHRPHMPAPHDQARAQLQRPRAHSAVCRAAEQQLLVGCEVDAGDRARVTRQLLQCRLLGGVGKGLLCVGGRVALL